MKMVSKIALTATLVIGLNGAALVAPAIAKKKEDAAPATPTISAPARAAAVEAHLDDVAQDQGAVDGAHGHLE